MASTIRMSGVLCVIAVGIIGPVGTGAEPFESAEALVEQALIAELGGDFAHRRKLLESAITVSPDYEPARWHAGMVHIDN